jgi:hypothetical protein
MKHSGVRDTEAYDHPLTVREKGGGKMIVSGAERERSKHSPGPKTVIGWNKTRREQNRKTRGEKKL